MTIQLPIYNESEVIERLLRHILALDYPTDKWEVQILDDSTDETTSMIEGLLSKWQAEVPVYHIRRSARKGFKAGALAAAQPAARGEVLAIFDADFVPPKDFLRRTVPYFEESDFVGFVQTRWGHLNEQQNQLTQLQAFGLNGHFFVEQSARYAAGYFTHFNGTAGLWRRQCILDAGGWQSDTLTEDLDLSYRAQLSGWKGRYLHHVVCPAELPAHMCDIKQQQKRWIKGAAQTAKKHSLRILRAKNQACTKKVHGLLHLFNSTVYPSVLVSSLLSVPLLYIKVHLPDMELFFGYASFFLFGFLGFCVFYAVMAYKLRPKGATRYLITHLFWFLSLSMGLAWVGSRAVAEGWMGVRSPFRRTPKQGSSSKRRYRAQVPAKEWIAEGLLALYFTTAVGYGIYFGEYGLLFFHVLLALGYGRICWHGIRQ